MDSETQSTDMTTHAGLNARQQVSIADNALYINPNENINVPLVTQVLEGPENFISWKKGMIRSLGFKRKLGFIYGKIKRPEDPENSEELEKWEQCNSVVLSWITNSVSKAIAGSLVHLDNANEAWEDLESRFGGSNGPTFFAIQEEIYNLRQGELTVENYYSEIVKLWT